MFHVLTKKMKKTKGNIYTYPYTYVKRISKEKQILLMEKRAQLARLPRIREAEGGKRGQIP